MATVLDASLPTIILLASIALFGIVRDLHDPNGMWTKFFDYDGSFGGLSSHELNDLIEVEDQ